MGTGNKGAYSGTRGSYEKFPKGSAERMHHEATSWARSEADRLESISKNQRNLFNTACVAYDEESGEYFYGRNGGIELKGDTKNPKLFGENGILPKQSFNRFSVGNCAEVDAINQALNSGAKLGKISISTIHTRKDLFGTTKEACENCTFAFKGRIKQNHTGWKAKGE